MQRMIFIEKGLGQILVLCVRELSRLTCCHLPLLQIQCQINKTEDILKPFNRRKRGDLIKSENTAGKQAAALYEPAYMGGLYYSCDWRNSDQRSSCSLLKNNSSSSCK